MPIANLRVKKDTEGAGYWSEWQSDIAGTDKGDFAVNGGIITFAANKRQTYFAYDDGITLPTSGITIVSVTIGIFALPGAPSSVKIFYVRNPISDIEIQEPSPYTGTGNHAFVQNTDGYTLATWTRANVFAYQYGILATSVAGGYADTAGFTIQVGYLQTPTTITVTGNGGIEAGGVGTYTLTKGVTGQGGIQVAGTNSPWFYGLGAPLELHGDQWGLMEFDIKQRPEDQS